MAINLWPCSEESEKPLEVKPIEITPLEFSALAMPRNNLESRVNSERKLA